MLSEAVEIMRLLWQGGLRSHRGTYFIVENAQLYSLPKEKLPVYVAAAGAASAELAARIGDGLIIVGAERKVVKAFTESGGIDKPKFGKITVCWDESEKRARRLAREIWPISAMPQALLGELPLPAHFEAASKTVTEDRIAEGIVCGPDPERHIDAIRECERAGCDHVYVHQVGKNQEGFFRFYKDEILPKFGYRNSSKTTFALRGHSMKIRDAMTSEVEYIGPDEPLKNAARRMQLLDIGFIPVCDNGRLVGTITDRDIAVRAVAQGLDLENIRVSDVMTGEVFFCYDDQDLDAAARTMREGQIRRLVVLDRDQRLVGILSLGDLQMFEAEERMRGETPSETSGSAA
jgi:CBS domain-containing protein